MLNYTKPIQIENGMIIGEEREDVRIFKGIPYAAPPTGNLRWCEPMPVENWEGIRKCTEYSAQAA